MAFEDQTTSLPDTPEPEPPAESGQPPRTAWEQRLQEARAQREKKLKRNARKSPVDESPPPPGTSPIDRAVAALESAPTDEEEQDSKIGAVFVGLWPRVKPALPLTLAFILGLGIGTYFFAGVRTPDTVIASQAPVAPVAPDVAFAEPELIMATPRVLSASLATADPQELIAVEPPELPKTAVTDLAVPDDSSPNIFATLLDAPNAPTPVTLASLALPKELPLPTSRTDRTELPLFPPDILPGSVSKNGPRVFVTAPGSLGAASYSDLPAQLSSLGAMETSIARVEFSVSKTHVRFYHVQDADDAARFAEAVGGEVRDFTTYATKPKAGTIELYLAGSGGRVAAAEPVRVAEPPAATATFGSAIQFLRRTPQP